MRAMRAILILSAVATVAAASAPARPGGHRWAEYGNRRYGYSACYPADLFRARPEAGARDGVAFAGPDGVALSVSAEPSAGTSMGEVMGALTRSLNGKVTYRASRPGWGVASGTRGADIFYARLVDAGGVIAQYVLVYPSARAATFAPLVSRMNACLKVG